MAEWFSGKGFTVYFSNGGIEGLYEGLIRLGRKLPAEEPLNKTMAHFRRLLDFPSGCRSFNIENPPDGFNDDNFVELARLISLFCFELTKEKSELEETGLFWDREARMSFLARLMSLYSLVETHLRERSIVIQALTVPLSVEEEITLERRRLEMIYEQTKNSLGDSRRLELYEKIVELNERDKNFVHLTHLNLVYLDYSELIDDSFTKEKKISIWKRILELETLSNSKEGIELAAEYLEEIERS